jgi:hypothetical protein
VGDLEERQVLAHFVAEAILNPNEETVEGAVGALAGASDAAFAAAMAAIRKTYPQKWPQIDEFETMLVGLRAKLRSGR